MKKLREKLRGKFKLALITVMTVFTCILPASASEQTTGTASGAIGEIGTILTSILGMVGGVTSEILSNGIWVIGMAFMVFAFIFGILMAFLRKGKHN